MTIGHPQIEVVKTFRAYCDLCQDHVGADHSEEWDTKEAAQLSGNRHLNEEHGFSIPLAPTSPPLSVDSASVSRVTPDADGGEFSALKPLVLPKSIAALQTLARDGAFSRTAVSTAGSGLRSVAVSASTDREIEADYGV